MRAAGETPLRAATLLNSAKPYSVPSLDPDRAVPCRILEPQNRQPPKAIFMHIHGGGMGLTERDGTRSSITAPRDTAGVLWHFHWIQTERPKTPSQPGPEDYYDAGTQFGAPLSILHWRRECRWPSIRADRITPAPTITPATKIPRIPLPRSHPTSRLLRPGTHTASI